MHILHTFLYTFPNVLKRRIYESSRGNQKENLFNNQEFFRLAVISFILITLMVDLGVM